MNESKISGSPPVVMAIYEVPGNEVNVLINQRQPAGVHQVIRDSKNQAVQAVPGGFYFIKMNCGQFSAIRKCLNLK
jgi:flagellar hook assembly protein FlgD